MNIAIIGTGNVGGALATRWSAAGHHILLGVRNLREFKGKELLKNPNTEAVELRMAAANAEAVLVATPPATIFEIIEQLGDVQGKVLIDATNSIAKGPEPYKTVYHCLVDKTRGEVVKCFNSTGFENMLNPVYDGVPIDMFMAGDSNKAKSVARQLALDCGFAFCVDFGKSDKVELLEKFALSWINLAIMQGQGRGIAFKLLRR
jgi:predicted dinucleotide-binding enzyme